MNNYNLDFLYYNTPLEYMGLDTDQDPQLDKISDFEVQFKNYMSRCSIQNYVTLIIKAFRDKSPDYISLEWALAKFEEGDDGEYFYVESYRKNKDITKIDSRQQEIIMKDGWETEGLDEFEIEFRDNLPQLQTWVTDALGSKTFTVNSAGGITTIEVEESPILHIRLEGKKLILKSNTDYFIEYF